MDFYKIFVSTVTPVSIADDTFLAKTVKARTLVVEITKNIERNVTYYVREEPWDVFGKGTAT